MKLSMHQNHNEENILSMKIRDTQSHVQFWGHMILLILINALILWLKSNIGSDFYEIR